METIPLTQLELNTTGRIKEIRCNSSIKRRLLDLGFIPNTPITPIMKSIAGDPIAYEIRNIIVAIRAQDADKILVSKWAIGKYASSIYSPKKHFVKEPLS